MILTSVIGEPTTAGPNPGVNDGPQKMRITVVLTSIEGTIAALTAAASLSRSLAAEIVIHVSEVVYFRYPLDRPPVVPAFFEKLCVALIEESNLDPCAINIEIHYCRDQLLSLKQTLKRQSLVVLGMQKSLWPKREKKLASALREIGHDVVLVYATSDPARPHTPLVAHRMLR
jgi:hypothetical protein